MTTEKAIVAGGCFWGMEELIRKLPGVTKTIVGYTGGKLSNPTYKDVKGADTGHAEAIEITFDPAELSYRSLLEFFFQIHDPTTRNRQGNDIGSSYRSAIFYVNDEQKKIAEQLIATLMGAHIWSGSIVTEVVPATTFYPAEDYHRDYLQRNPNGYTCHYIRPNWTLAPKEKSMKRILGLLLVGVFALSIATAQAATLPDPQMDDPLAAAQSSATIVLAGGCFWGIQAVFQHVKGVTQAVSGYAGGSKDTAQYHTVSMGDTGHAEFVQVTYDPSQVTLGKILKVYFSVAHDPTELNRQGPDSGTQYRSTIFFANPQQQKIADAYIKQLNTVGTFSSPIVTTLEPLKGFYAAEDYHQNYAKLHPFNPYIMINDAPKVAHLEKELPDLYVK